MAPETWHHWMILHSFHARAAQHLLITLLSLHARHPKHLLIILRCSHARGLQHSLMDMSSVCLCRSAHSFRS